MNLSLKQQPEPGKNLIFREGDFLKLKLSVPPNMNGKAFLRTNLFDPLKKNQELINRIEKNVPRRFQDWGDFPMNNMGNGLFSIEIPLSHVGFYEAKAYFIHESETEPIWPEGDNIFIKVEPAKSIISNSLYSAFVRLFIDDEAFSKIKTNLQKQPIIKNNQFNIIPESGKFKDLIPKLDFIIDELGFDIIMLLPVHPVPTTYARMGMFGSPYAALDFFSVDPALAEFDKETTPLQQFTELIDEIHARHARIFMDIPANHTGWASQLQIHHPDYFVKNNEGKFVSPGAWGVTWSDLSELNYSNKGLWKYMADVFLFWCEKGIDGFRCDAGYMIPSEAWKYIIAKVRYEYPSTIFLLEGLGGKVKTTELLLTDSNMNWAYSEMFQNYSQHQMEGYLNEFSRISFQKGPLINFSETHDNQRLAAVSKEFSRLRNGITALLSDTGTYAITAGVEWYADEKIDVHQLTSMRWGNKDNQVEYIKLLNRILKTHPAFKPNSTLSRIHTSDCNSIAYLKEHPQFNDKMAIIANLSNENNSVYIDKTKAELFIENTTDLLSGKNITFEDNIKDYEVTLQPYEIIALSNNNSFIDDLHNKNINKDIQRIKGKRILRKQLVKLFENQDKLVNEDFIDQQLTNFTDNPAVFFDKHFNKKPAVIHWKYPQDTERQVIIPNNTPLLIHCSNYFRFKIQNNNKTIEVGEGFYLGENKFISIVSPNVFETSEPEFIIQIEVFKEKKVIKKSGHLFKANHNQLFKNINEFDSRKIEKDDLLSSLAVNKMSGISVLRGSFSNLHSKYDALIGANMNPKYPEDKHIMLTRLRGWTVFKGFSREIIQEYQKTFEHYQNTTEYYFEMPTGGGKLIPLILSFKFSESDNIINCKIRRLNSAELPTPPSDQAVRIIIRPDTESRNHHELTKAFTGPESEWTTRITEKENGFLFEQGNNILGIYIDNGSFIREDEWQYMVSRSIEKERGMDGDSDLYSPGYFKTYLKANEEAIILAKSGTRESFQPGKENLKLSSDIKSLPEIQNINQTLKNSIRKFIVNRNSNKTIIAGYPWFLDWGRDTLICLRGVVSAGYINEAKSIITEFAAFEENGTLPNVIRGDDTSNRETSDAPLWMFAAIKDIIDIEGEEFLNTNCKGRNLKEVLNSIAENYQKGTPNGIRMDKKTGLIYSPSHFTWMDTNYPAGTPREGYPIEIQALWYHAIQFLTKIEPGKEKWKKLSEQIKSSISKHYITQRESNSLFAKEIFLSDCLHTNGYQPVNEAVKDDHIRPNQIFAITFDAIDNISLCREILSTCEELIIPGAIRSLADRPTEYPLPVYHNDQLLNNPYHPYKGRYNGDEDYSRKPAYHNGTAWTWPFPSYCEALVKVYGNSAIEKSRDILSTSSRQLNSGCINQIPEILDGDYPHSQKGCFAQAWGITELYRVAKILKLL